MNYSCMIRLNPDHREHQPSLDTARDLHYKPPLSNNYGQSYLVEGTASLQQAESLRSVDEHSGSLGSRVRSLDRGPEWSVAIYG